MIKEAIDRILGLAPPATKTVEGVEFSKERLVAVAPDAISGVKLHTLMGLSQLISENLEGIGLNRAGTGNGKVTDPTLADILLLVESPTSVKMLGLQSDKWGRRTEYAHSTCESCSFSFGQFMTPEAFVISLQAHFVPATDDIDYVLRVASNLSTEAVATAEDDGISQKASLRKGVVLRETGVLRSRVKLAPYRTFREVVQPASEFIFRLRGGSSDEPPNCALFEADGGKWKIDAVQNVAAYLSRNAKDVAVVS